MELEEKSESLKRERLNQFKDFRKYKEELLRFRLPILIGITLFLINIGYSIYVNITDPTPDLLRKQLEIEANQLVELQKAKQALFRIQETYLQDAGKDTVQDVLDNR